EGITQEHVDKVIALGLIDVRDIEEVGTGPLMEELGLDEETAQRVVDRCTEEAKIVAVEQEQKKGAEAAAKALGAASASASASGEAGVRGVDGVAFANPLLQQVPLRDSTPADDTPESSGTLPGAMEATEGIAPEIATHKQDAIADGA